MGIFDGLCSCVVGKRTLTMEDFDKITLDELVLLNICGKHLQQVRDYLLKRFVEKKQRGK